MINNSEDRPIETIVKNTDTAPVETIVEEDVAETVEDETEDSDPGSAKVVVVEAP